MNDIRRLKEQQREAHPAFGSYLECMTRSLFTGLASCTIAFSASYFLQKLLIKKLPYGLQGVILVSCGCGVVVSYQVTATRTKSCQAAWMAAEDNIGEVFVRILITNMAIFKQFRQKSIMSCGYLSCFRRLIDKKAILNRNIFISNLTRQYNSSQDTEENDFDLEPDRDYKELLHKYMPVLNVEETCYIIQPYIKWGPKKNTDTTPQLQLAEAVALVNSLPGWSVLDSALIPLESLDKRELFGKGKLEELKKTIRGNKSLTSVFVNLGMLRGYQISELEKIFRVQVFDKYKIVMEILRLHASSKHAKLQVAMAEIPYLKSKLKDFQSNSQITNEMPLDVRRKILQQREIKLKEKIKKLRGQRELLRNKRVQRNFPVVAVVGYTNAGKTTLIKAISGDKKMQPRNQLFATLDVKLHAGILPSNLEVLFVDTVGFISDISADLLECFAATLEDALLADIIVHVQDVSHADLKAQNLLVLKTLESLLKNSPRTENLLKNIITVGNKIDMVDERLEFNDPNVTYVSAKNMTGVDELRRKIEVALIEATGRVPISIRVPMGGEESRWLYKNSTVSSTYEDSKDNQYLIMKVIITKAKLQQFRHVFIKK